MTMNYPTLIGSKGQSGAVATWARYSDKVLDIPVVVDEAQFLLYEILRVREMRTEWTFGMVAGQANVPLPTRFLDPVGKVFDTTNVTDYDQVIGTSILKLRAYDNSFSGNLGTNAFTTTNGSGLVSVNLPAHGFNQDSTFTTTGATSANGLQLNGSFPIVSITDVNDFVINVGDPTDSVATTSGVDGGAAAAYVCENLVAGSPTCWGIWDEELKFNTALDMPMTCKLLYYRQPKLLSQANQTNFLTARYPKLMRIACLAACADFMRDDQEFQKQMTSLTSLIQTTASYDDLSYRGASFGTDTP